jgi:hypothetical protein
VNIDLLQSWEVVFLVWMLFLTLQVIGVLTQIQARWDSLRSELKARVSTEGPGSR